MMLRSPYSLFHYKTLEKRMLSFGFPKNLSDRLQKITKWVAYIQSGNLQNPATDAEFLHDLCVDVLGYKSPFDSNSKTWELEFTPTATLGFFGTEINHILVEIIIGNIRTKPQLNYATTEWIIVTDYRSVRLYSSTRIPIFYEQFNLEDIINNSEYLRQFYFMLCRRTLLGANFKEQSRLSKLLVESAEIVQEIINSYYSQYQKIRGQLIKDFSYRLQLISNDSNLKEKDSNLTELDKREIELTAIAKAQKLLNRLIFITYSEDHHLLPQLILNAYQFINPYIDQPIWENYKAIFSWISKGKSTQAVFGYGSSLFEFDSILDKSLFVGDELCRQIKELCRFDFNQDISRMAIAIILEELTKDLVINQTLIKRKKLKYPHKILQSYESIKIAIKSHLDQKISSQKTDRETNQELDNWILCKSALENLKIYVPECDSGVSLVMALNVLVDEYQQVYEHLDLVFDDSIAVKILQNQIYGCCGIDNVSDRSVESLEIAKLNLWLNTVNLNQVLVNLENNIQVEDKCTFREVINLARSEGNLVTLK